ncbi:MAG: TIGR03621 family F420-dependent LLM class oxidoreductase [Ilumatobacter sp.]|nr:TIGR03621 family F420-dependent LLM class oxidoreductase [bacterium]MDG1266826.1 TIGR03621 family F420-dependent LLM class oxidoreductase [Ilumatobacter sp.]MDG2040387.1 TIGR03621 family F420-dependent LLM class oxidoreductase [Ilumatobacter sp.]NKB40173.1 TIGR03621 family F420-dependent LLM class oxidoreductase [Ilumatobacter sp.]
MRRPFRFGVQSYAAKSPQDWREQAKRAESQGFSTFSVADHVIGPGPALTATNHPVQNVAAIPAMAVAIEATDAISIGARVFCVDYRQPVMFAKELATLDFFAGGRLELGLGAGWLQGEYEAMGVEWDRAGVRLDRFEETLTLIRQHFGDGLVEIDGEHVHAAGFEGLPKPPNGVPPIMIGGGAKRVLGIAGREADIVSLNFNNSSGKIGPDGVGSSTAQLTAQKVDWIRAGADQRTDGKSFDDIEIEIGGYFTVVTDEREATLAKMAPMFELEPEQLAEHPHALIGSVDTICEQLIERREIYGISYVTFGGSASESVVPVVERLAGT